MDSQLRYAPQVLSCAQAMEEKSAVDPKSMEQEFDAPPLKSSIASHLDSWIIRALLDPSMITEVLHPQIQMMHKLNQDLRAAMESASKATGPLQVRLNEIIAMFQSLRRQCLEAVIINRPQCKGAIDELTDILHEDQIDRAAVIEVMVKICNMNPSLGDIAGKAHDIEMVIQETSVTFKHQLSIQSINWSFWTNSLLFAGASFLLASCIALIVFIPASAPTALALGLGSATAAVATWTVVTGGNFVMTAAAYSSTRSTLAQINKSLSDIKDRVHNIDEAANKLREQINEIQFMTNSRYQKRDIKRLKTVLETLKGGFDDLEKAATKPVDAKYCSISDYVGINASQSSGLLVVNESKYRMGVCLSVAKWYYHLAAVVEPKSSIIIPAQYVWYTFNYWKQDSRAVVTCDKDFYDGAYKHQFIRGIYGVGTTLFLCDRNDGSVACE